MVSGSEQRHPQVCCAVGTEPETPKGKTVKFGRTLLLTWATFALHRALLYLRAQLKVCRKRT